LEVLSFLLSPSYFLTPKKPRAFLRKVESIRLINYIEIAYRLITAIDMILYADYSRLPIAFEGLG
jgi:hypothetical protein